MLYWGVQHSGNRNFGIPLPFSVKNPYGISAHAALAGTVSIPEGPLADIDAPLFKPWFDALTRWLLPRGLSIHFYKQLKPARKYIPSAMPYYVKKARALRLTEFDAVNPAPSLEQIAAVLQGRAEGHVDLHDLITFLEGHLPARELASLRLRFPCLEMGN